LTLGEKDNELKLRPRSLMHLKYDWEPEKQGPEHSLDVTRARVGLEAEYGKWLDTEVTLDARSSDILLDAWGRINFLKQLRLTGGYFKRPFFKLRMRAAHGVQVIERGTLDNSLKDGMDYSSRKAGVQLDGRLHKDTKLRYFLGFFGDFEASRGIVSSNDLAAGLTLKPVDELRLGASTVFKFLSSDEAHTDWTAAYDVYLALDIDNWYMLLEGVAGEDPRYAGTPFFTGFLAMMSYTIDIYASEPLEGLRPVIKFELTEPDFDITDDLAMRATVGMDLLFVYDVRLGLNAERVDADRNNREGEEDGYILMALMGFRI